MTESEFLKHEPCPDCGSSDALAVYTDGHTFCFSCQTRTAGHGQESKQPMQTNVNFKGSAQRLQKRKISQATCEKYKIYRDEAHLRFPYFDSTGRLQGFKTKDKLKKFKYEGISTDTLFGQHLFPSTGKRIVITEGELDAASCYEAMDGWPMVSLPHGAASAKKDLQKQIPLLQGYEEIVLFFDNDDAGRRAVEQAASVLPLGKVKIARLEQYKDASDALQANDANAICRAIWDAKAYQPDGIIDGKTLLEQVTTPIPPCNHSYPFPGLQSMTHGIRYGELTTITAGTGQGKSTFCRQLATDLLNQGEKVGYIALEESNRRTALGLMSVAVGKALHLGEHEYTTLKDAYDSTIAGWNLYLYDHFGSLSSDIIYSRIEYMALGLDIKVIFLDHLSILLSGLDGSMDERRTIDKTMTDLRSLVERTGIKLFLVSHLRRAQGDKAIEDGQKVSIGMLRGSASISQLSDTVIALERDQQNPDDVSTLRVLKNRYSGETGVAAELKYDKTTCKFNETKDTVFSPSTDF
jgi:twinkle protein